MKLFLVGGFLGSGKTTAILQAARSLKALGKKTGIVTNDQGVQLVDTRLLQLEGIAVEEVTGACFCCNFKELVHSIRSLRHDDKELPDVIFAESVGSCTDLMATVVNPMLHLNKLPDLPLSVFADIRLLSIYLQSGKRTFHKDVNYIYEQQLKEADILVVNKTDLFSKQQLRLARELIAREFPGKTIVYQHSLTEEGVQEWLKLLLNYTSLGDPKPTLKMDYERYGAGEAQLAWLDGEMEILADNGDAVGAAMILVNMIRERIHTMEYPIGHLKFLLQDRQWHGKISFTAAELTAQVEFRDHPSTHKIILLVNARVQTTPEALKQAMADAIRKTAHQTGCRITENKLDSFQPGTPSPTFRMEYPVLGK